MPNHVGSQLFVTGQFADRSTLVAFLQGTEPQFSVSPDHPQFADRTPPREEEISLNKVIPVPVEVLAADFTKVGYNWCLRNWGCRGCYNVSLRHDPGESVSIYTFNTAWSPFTTKILDLLANRFPTLGFRYVYAEQGSQFYGVYDTTTGEQFHRKFKKEDFEDGREPTSDDEDEYVFPALTEKMKQYRACYEISG